MFRLVNIKAGMQYGFNFQSNKQMKKFLTTLLTLWIMLPATMSGQDEVKIEFSDGIEADRVKSNMERNASLLLTAINRAERTGSDINYSGIDIDNLASQSIGMMWNNVHFHIVDEDIVGHFQSVKDRQGYVIGYQVRNIAIEMKPLDDSYKSDLNQEVCISFDRDGTISDFNVTLGGQLYIRLLEDGEKLNDMNRRMFLLNWVERYCNAYSSKDIGFIEKVFTGNDVASIDSPERNQYFSNLKRVFRKSDYVNVQIEDISIVRHGCKPNFYGVTLKQGWFTKSYSDECILFMIWDFTDDNAPSLRVSAVQPMETDEKDLYKLSDIKLP